MPPKAPHDVAAIRARLDEALNATYGGRQPFNAKYGVYVFYDYDGEPIYVAQSREQVRARIRRHLTNQRTDAVAINLLDPFEVAEIEVFPFLELAPWPEEEDQHFQKRVKSTLDRAEYTVFQKVLAESALGAVLNEGEIARQEPIELPESHRCTIIPSELFDRRQHPDVRIARRASTVANLARVISERDVSKGLRRTLLTQARRLERLARERLKELGIDEAP